LIAGLTIVSVTVLTQLRAQQSQENATVSKMNIPLMIVSFERDPLLSIKIAADDTKVSHPIAFAVDDFGRLFVADLRTGATLAYFEMDSMQPIAVFLFPDGKTLAAGDKSGVLMMWDLETGEPKFRTQAHKAQINAITLSPDGRTLVTCAHDGSVRIWHSGDEDNVAGGS